MINYKKKLFSAPGTYCPENVKLDRTPQFTFGLRTPLKKINDTPGNCNEKDLIFFIFTSIYFDTYNLEKFNPNNIYILDNFFYEN